MKDREAREAIRQLRERVEALEFELKSLHAAYNTWFDHVAKELGFVADVSWLPMTCVEVKASPRRVKMRVTSEPERFDP